MVDFASAFKQFVYKWIVDMNWQLFLIYFMIKYLLISLLLACNINALRIPCEFVASNRNQSLSFPLSDRQTIVSTLYDFDMIIDPIDGSVSKTIQNSGTWQASNIHLIAYFLKPHFNVLNIGSQTGLQAIIMGTLIREKGRLFILQPYSVSYKIVKKNIYLNDLQNITKIYQVGASDTQARAKMLISKQNTGGAEIFMTNTPPISDQRGIDLIEEYVQIDLVDDILPKDVRIDFVLMDVQKMEVEALLGMKNILQRSKNIIIFLQWSYASNSKRNEAKTLRLLTWLKEKQFQAYKYIEDQQNKCAIGTMQLIADIYQLMKIPVQDILLIPRHIDPSNYAQQ